MNIFQGKNTEFNVFDMLDKYNVKRILTPAEAQELQASCESILNKDTEIFLAEMLDDNYYKNDETFEYLLDDLKQILNQYNEFSDTEKLAYERTLDLNNLSNIPPDFDSRDAVEIVYNEEYLIPIDEDGNTFDNLYDFGLYLESTGNLNESDYVYIEPDLDDIVEFEEETELDFYDVCDDLYEWEIDFEQTAELYLSSMYYTIKDGILFILLDGEAEFYSIDNL